MSRKQQSSSIMNEMLQVSKLNNSVASFTCFNQDSEMDFGYRSKENDRPFNASDYFYRNRVRNEQNTAGGLEDGLVLSFKKLDLLPVSFWSQIQSLKSHKSISKSLRTNEGGQNTTLIGSLKDRSDDYSIDRLPKIDKFIFIFCCHTKKVFLVSGFVYSRN